MASYCLHLAFVVLERNGLWICRLRLVEAMDGCAPWAVRLLWRHLDDGIGESSKW